MSPAARLSALALLLLLGACQSPQRDLARDSREALDRWSLEGRLGYRSGNDGGSASFNWVQRNPGAGRIHFSGPMGFGSARLEWSPDHAQLEHGGDTVRAQSPSMLAWRLTGLILPVEQLRYWVRGLAAPEPAATQRHESDGRLKQLHQAGWQLTFERYQKVTGLALPHRIRAEQDDQRFTVLIQSWQPAP
jgi:outer membrane lipoprotein LolB